ncbi:unnamed protein product [Caenorhabditis auriculariae]|uniref:alpha-1,2-Mannosidase n=1 Tax=Caenorhabditis auriculariae TaxID=2777116 RepID=A0A8S1H549_9PELO|nr:unnamed protein product [Caenorhabditis auriculariae]
MSLRSHEQLVASVGLLFLITVCITAFFFLPSSGADDYLYHQAKHAIPIRDADVREEIRRREQVELKRKVEEANINPPPIPKPEIGAGDDTHSRQIFVKQMIKFAWDGYKNYAWGENELRPITKRGHSASIFGYGKTGATIVDALDTLYIAGLKEEYQDARKWIDESLDFKKVAKGEVSVFETNIRFVGGLLSAYALTKDKMFLKKAEEIATTLLPAFNTPTGIPLALVDVESGNAKNYAWAAGGCSILSEFGSLQLEFDYLSNLTGNTVFAEKATKVRKVLTSLEKPDGLYPIYLNPKSGKWGQRDFSLGAMADSFYEYLLKQWISTGKKDNSTKREYDEAIAAMERKMLFVSPENKLTYFANLRGNRVEHKMEHLACFAGGMFALQSINEVDETAKSHYLDLGERLAETCHESYARATTGIGPEAFRFNSGSEAKTDAKPERYYILRPEVVETWFYLWRITKKEKYRDWAWDHVQNLEKYCKVGVGYSGIKDVYESTVQHDDVQQSFLFAELFKYLYLIFSEDSVLPLDQWVFNTEAHPFLIRND